jgi:hypothetical protein
MGDATMSRTYLWIVLMVSILALTFPAKAEELTVAIDLEATPVADPSTITSTYFGPGPEIYAFLVVSGIEGVTGVLIGYSLDADTTLVNDGFTCLTPWVQAESQTYGFEPAPGPAGRSSPAVVGYWSLHLTEGSSTVGTMRLVAPGGVNGDAVLAIDGNHRALPAQILMHAGVNASAPDPTEQRTSAEFLDLAEHHVLMQFRGQSLLLPPGTIGAPLESLTDSDSTLARVLAPFRPLRVDAVFPTATPADSITYTIDEVPVRLPDLWRILKLTLPRDSAVDSLISDLDSLASVQYAEHNGHLTLHREPSDPEYRNQWGLNNTGQAGPPDVDIDAPEAWDVTTGSSDITVAVLDTGVDDAHEDFQGRTIIGDVGFGGDDHPEHGTEVMGTIGAATDNGRGIAGVDWNCRLESQWLRHMNLDEEAQALHDILGHGVRAANMSFGGETTNLTEQNALYYAFLSGISLFASMGNDYLVGNPVEWPAAYTEIVTAVGSIGPNGRRAPDSNTGAWIDLAAPGMGIRVLEPNNGYSWAGGTSFACPYVCGAAALLLSRCPSLTDVDVEQILERTAHHMSPDSFDVETGWGRVSARDALD